MACDSFHGTELAGICMWVYVPMHSCKLRSLPAETPQESLSACSIRWDRRGPQEIIPAALTEREDEGKTKSTGNTQRNVPWNWKLYMLTICQGSACNWNLKVSTSTTASQRRLDSRHLSVNNSVFSWDGWIAPFWPLLQVWKWQMNCNMSCSCCATQKHKGWGECKTSTSLLLPPGTLFF